jgi:two-component sensor histidine kinase
LGIIVNELLTNAMKYAFPGRDTGIIRVSCEKRENKVFLVVHDDGIGLPEGFDIEQSTGLGMNLVRMLCRQLDGTVRIENDNGAKVTLEITV